MDLSQAQWEILQPVFVEPRRADGKGRPWKDARAVLNGVLWILRTGAPWQDLPSRYPPYQTCHRRFQQWQQDGRFEVILQNLGRGLSASRRPGFKGRLHRRHLQRGEKNGSGVGKTKRGKGSKIMAITDRNGFPVAVHVASASPHETRLVAATVEGSFAPHPPKKLMGDLAYDRDPLDETLKQDYGIELIAPHKSNRRKPKTQDGRALRRYCRRWKIERFFAWLHNFRRVVIPWEYHESNFLGMVQLACIVILLRRY
jgi:transposase